MNLIYNRTSTVRSCASNSYIQWQKLFASSTNDESTPLTSLKNAIDKLEFSLEGSKNTAASANLAFLERDPSNRPPRAVFQVEASSMTKQYIVSSMKEAKAACDNSLRNCILVSTEEIQVRKSLQMLLSTAEENIKNLDREIENAMKNLSKLDNGLSKKD